MFLCKYELFSLLQWFHQSVFTYSSQIADGSHSNINVNLLPSFCFRSCCTLDVPTNRSSLWVSRLSANMVVIWCSRSISEVLVADLKSFPFLTIRVIQQFTVDKREYFPITSTLLTSAFYIDELATGGDTIEVMRSLQKEFFFFSERKIWAAK